MVRCPKCGGYNIQIIPNTVTNPEILRTGIGYSKMAVCMGCGMHSSSYALFEDCERAWNNGDVYPPLMPVYDGS